ncbi:MAG: alanine/glycine:cation symporter family protein [Lachnospiraceae bacterium]
MDIGTLMEVIIYDYLWGTPLVVIILTVGAYLTIRTGFFQLRHFPATLKACWRRIFNKDGDDQGAAGVLSSFEAMSVAIGTTVGVGNIGGVATAIAVGGPGAIFWMWVAGLFGMCIKMAEISLAVHYRSKDKNNEAYGGPNYYIKKGIGIAKNWKALAKVLGFIFAFGFMTGFIINIQTYTVSEAIAYTFNFNMILMGVVFTVLLYIMIAGGLKGLGRIASKLVPFMCLFYIGAGLIIIFQNVSSLPHVFGLIFGSAFKGTAAVGGFAGAAFKLAIQTGLSRSVFSNEAGWGSAPMIHASARVNHPIKQGILGVFEVFVDTFIICSITGLIIMVTGEWSSGLDGASLTLSAVEAGLGIFSRAVVALATFLFGITTASGLYAQMEVIVRYIVGDSKLKDTLLKIYKWTYPLPGLALVIISEVFGYSGSTIWLFSDASTALPIFANIVTLFILAPKFVELLKDYKARFMGIGKVDPNTRIFFDDDENIQALQELEKEGVAAKR